MNRNRKQGGFTLIELLIVVAIIGIIAAIAIPNLLNAIDRGKQKRTMADTRSIASACEAYAVDVNFYPIQGTLGAFGSGNIDAVIEPTFIKAAPDNDGWANPLQYVSGPGGEWYSVLSFGKDGAADAATYVSGTTTQSFDNDIVFSNGSFIQWPDGIQT